ncbi:MAG: FAD-dependent oxidoreductase [Bacillota bacterium]|nr:FAD-dependent oxidoreductase [Bacillota bacterium]
MKHRQISPEMKLILVGGGHAHIHVMHRIKHLQTLADVILISPAREQLYSGMASGYVEGIYTSGEIAFDLARICEQMQIQWIQGRVCHIDADAQVVSVDNGQTYPYDVLSLNIGSEIRDPDLPDANQTRIKVKPLENLIKLRQLLDDASLHTQRAHCVLRTSVLGGGAAGVEMSLAIRAAADRAGWQPEIHLWEKHADILAKYSDRTRHYALEKLKLAGIRLHCQASLTDQPETAEHLPDRQQADDLVILATGSQASDLFAYSSLQVDGKGYLQVNEFLQSTHQPSIFGAGDCISLITDPDMPKAGVFATRQSPFLLANLQRFLQKKSLRQFRQQRRFLSILSTGHQTAILDWGRLSIAGKLPWQIKNLIDRRFMRRYQI